MSDVAVIAFGAVSPLGEGEGAVSACVPGEVATSRVRTDDTLSQAGFARPFCARAGVELSPERDRATALLERALASCAASLDDVSPGWRSRRVGLALGTSSGGMGTFERDPSRFAGTYLGPVLEATRPVDVQPFSLVLGACASGALAIGLGRAWLDQDACDVVLAGGFDAVAMFVAAGFEALRASTARGVLAPFRVARDGLALGEGAAVLAMVRSAPRAIGWVRGFGASCDAQHLTAPDLQGAGLARAALAALESARTSAREIALVSAHGTATAANDAAEARALGQLGIAEAPVTALKGVTGHTLGAAGALESLDALVALDRRVVPASVGDGPTIDGVRVLDRWEALEPGPCLKLSAAFGGANAALVLARSPEPGAPLPARPVHVVPAVAVSELATSRASLDELLRPERLAGVVRVAEDRLARMDDLVRLALATVARLEARVGSLAGAGIVVGHGLATYETNRAFLARLREAGVRRAAPRRFPYTTPNAAAGECATAFSLTGPAFAVGGGAHGGLEALAVAQSLVAGAVSDRIVVVAVDEGGAATRATFGAVPRGAVATLVTSQAPSGPSARLEATCALRQSTRLPVAPDPSELAAHPALLPLALGVEPRPVELEAVGPGAPGMIAKARLFWL